MKSCLQIYSVLGVLSIAASGASAQTTFNWRSESSTGNWNQIDNWYNGTANAIPTGNDVLRFGNNANTTMVNDLPSGQQTHRFQIFFDSGATNSRTISGSTPNLFFDFGGNVPSITNNSTATHSINFPIADGNSGGSLDIFAETGDLNFGGTVSTSGTGSKTLYLQPESGRTITFNNTMTQSASAPMSVVIIHGGTVVYSAANNYTGSTTVTTGRLNVEASHSGGANYSVGSAGIIGGGTGAGPTGVSIDAPMSLSGTVTAGTTSATGKLNFTNASFTVNSGATFSLKIGGTAVGAGAGGGYDQLAINSNTLSLAGATLALSDFGNYFKTIGAGAYVGGLTFRLIDRPTGAAAINTASTSNLFAGLAQGATFDAADTRFKINYNAGDGNDVEITTVPEPTSGLLVSFIGVTSLKRRRRS